MEGYPWMSSHVVMGCLLGTNESRLYSHHRRCQIQQPLQRQLQMNETLELGTTSHVKHLARPCLNDIPTQ